jgi:parallel beta-helix repeat protein
MKTLRAAAAFAFLAVSAAAASAAATVNVPGDSATIMQAIDLAYDGDTIIVAAGTYPGFVQVIQRNNLTIQASGVVIIASNSKQKGAPAQVTVFSSANITFDGFTISNAQGDGIAVSTSSNVLISHCTVEKSKGSGILVGGVYVGGTDVTIADCIVTTTGKGHAGISVAALGPQRFRVQRCTVSKAGGAGISVRGRSVLIEDCVVTGSKKAGIELDRTGGTNDAIVRRCKITSAGDTGIVVAGSGHVVEDNEITDSKQYGISVIEDTALATTGAIVRRNRIAKTKKKDGILASAPQCTVEANTIDSTHGDGIRVSDTGSRILANTVTSAGAYGVHLLGSGHTVTGNSATGKKADLWDESTGSTLTGNTFVKIK